MFCGTAQVSHQVCQFFVGSECLLVRVPMVDKNKALLATFGHNVIRKEEKKA